MTHSPRPTPWRQLGPPGSPPRLSGWGFASDDDRWPRMLRSLQAALLAERAAVVRDTETLDRRGYRHFAVDLRKLVARFDSVLGLIAEALTVAPPEGE